MSRKSSAILHMPRDCPSSACRSVGRRVISLPSALLPSGATLYTNNSVFHNKRVRLAKVCCASATSVILQSFSYAAIIAVSHHSFRPAICRSAFIFSAPAPYFSAGKQELVCGHMGRGDNLFNKKMLHNPNPTNLTRK